MEIYIAIGLVALVIILTTIIRTFLNRNWKLIYTAFGNEEYFRITAKLKSEEIKYKTVTPYSFDNRTNRFKDNTQYDIYVKKDEEHLAVKSLQKRN
ncbi:hypothetical protein PH210_22580 [Paenibacillus sp. BSR1-1]|uniref:hypothetical protein n=1 Tax=Paenibacillus sp. BSR1-1 TaxID=3020845 RepID=UPI0025AFEFC9|nr:hypothetical protein [Paenibacillus sp. BSR1-1]MDN3018962.1 hypothetical protein [Paenibacillus sp. BSR1-1]